MSRDQKKISDSIYLFSLFIIYAFLLYNGKV